MNEYKLIRSKNSGEAANTICGYLRVLFSLSCPYKYEWHKFNIYYAF